MRAGLIVVALMALTATGVNGKYVFFCVCVFALELVTESLN